MLNAVTPFEWVQGLLVIGMTLVTIAGIAFFAVGTSERRRIKAKQIEQKNMTVLLEDIRALKGERTGDYTKVLEP